MKRRMSVGSSSTVAALAILAGLIALGLAARRAMAVTTITGTTIITTPGEYLVTADFTGSIIIEASDVDLNLGGHTITVVGASTGVWVVMGTASVHINNGTLIGSPSGIAGVVVGGADVHVNNLTATNVGIGIFLESDGGGDFINSTVCSNNIYGIVVNSQGNTIDVGNVCSNNVVSGIAVFSQSNSIKGNTALNNGIDDLYDTNLGCDSNTWVGNRFKTANQPSCIH